MLTPEEPALKHIPFPMNDGWKLNGVHTCPNNRAGKIISMSCLMSRPQRKDSCLKAAGRLHVCDHCSMLTQPGPVSSSKPENTLPAHPLVCVPIVCTLWKTAPYFHSCPKSMPLGKKTRSTATARQPRHWDEGQYEFPWCQRELESFCLFGMWAVRSRTDVPSEHSPLWPPVLIKLSKWSEKRQQHTGPKGESQRQTGTAMSHRDTSQVPVQPTGLSQLLPWVGAGHAPSLDFVLIHGPKLPVTSRPRLSHTLNSLPNTSLLMDFPQSRFQLNRQTLSSRSGPGVSQESEKNQQSWAGRPTEESRSSHSKKAASVVCHTPRR